MKLDLSKDIYIYDFKASFIERFNTIHIIVNCDDIQLYNDVKDLLSRFRLEFRVRE